MSALKGRHFLSTGGAFTLFLAGLWSIMVSSGAKWRKNIFPTEPCRASRGPGT